MVRELHELADICPDVREYILGLLHEHEMSKRATRTLAARVVAATALGEIEKTKA